MFKKFTISIVMILFAVTTANAGSATLRKSGTKMSLWCDNGGCYSRVKSKKTKRLGAGGSSNFNKHKKAFKGKGWK